LQGRDLDIVAFWAAGDRGTRLRTLALLAAPVVILTLLEPFDSGSLPFALRLAYWTILLTALGLAFPLAVRLVRRATRAHAVPALTILAGACALAALPVWALVEGLDWVLAAIVAPLFGRSAVSEPPFAGAPLDLAGGYVSVCLVTALIVGGISLLRLAGARRAEPPAVVAAPGVRFLSRLPAGVAGDLVCIRMEDHYLRVTTRNGEALILMRMRDALSELKDYPGLQIHRSWWVSVDAIARLARSGRRLEVVLRNGARAPVSSSHRARVEGLVFGAERAA
jgi:hypothetical protein